MNLGVATPLSGGDADAIRVQLAEEKKELQALVDDLEKAVMEKESKLDSLQEEKE